MIRLLANVPLLVAEAGGSAPVSTVLLSHLVAVVVYSIVGMLVLGSCIWVMKRLLPFSITKEIEQDQNTALAIIIGSVVMGMSIIIAAAIL